MPHHEIHSKAFLGDTEAIAKLIAANPEIINELDDNNATPVFLACHAGRLSAVDLLIKKGADLSIPDIYSNTPLHRAMQAMVWNKGKDIEVYHKIAELILQKDIRLMTIRNKDLAYPLYKLCDYKEAMDRVLLAIKELGSISQILPVFRQDLQHSDFGIQQSAAITLSNIYKIIPETRQDILQAFIQFFHSELNRCKWGMITKALYNIMQARLEMNPLTLQQIISNFIGYLNDKTMPYGVTIDSIDILGEACKINSETTVPQIIPALVKILNIGNDLVRKKAANVLGSISKIVFPKKIFDSIHDFIQSFSNQTESLEVKKYVLDTLVSICEAIPEIVPLIVSTLVSSLRNKAESDELKSHIITALQKICTEIATIEDKQKALEIAWQMKPIIEQTLQDENLDLKFKQPLGRVLAEMYLSIPALKDKEVAAQAEKAAAKVEERLAKSPKSDTPKLSVSPTIWSQTESSQEKQSLLKHRRVPHEESNTP